MFVTSGTRPPETQGCVRAEARPVVIDLPSEPGALVEMPWWHSMPA